MQNITTPVSQEQKERQVFIETLALLKDPGFTDSPEQTISETWADFALFGMIPTSVRISPHLHTVLGDLYARTDAEQLNPELVINVALVSFLNSLGKLPVFEKIDDARLEAKQREAHIKQQKRLAYEGHILEPKQVVCTLASDVMLPLAQQKLCLVDADTISQDAEKVPLYLHTVIVSKDANYLVNTASEFSCVETNRNRICFGLTLPVTQIPDTQALSRWHAEQVADQLKILLHLDLSEKQVEHITNNGYLMDRVINCVETDGPSKGIYITSYLKLGDDWTPTASGVNRAEVMLPTFVDYSILKDIATNGVRPITLIGRNAFDIMSEDFELNAGGNIVKLPPN